MRKLVVVIRRQSVLLGDIDAYDQDPHHVALPEEINECGVLLVMSLCQGKTRMCRRPDGEAERR